MRQGARGGHRTRGYDSVIAPTWRFTLLSKVLGEVLRAVASLEMFTLIARNVCERMVDEGAVPVLFHLLATSNRSVPSQKVVGHGLRALLNIARCQRADTGAAAAAASASSAPASAAPSSLCAAICAQPDGLVVLVDLAQGAYRDKANHGQLWDVLALLHELVLRGPAEWRESIASGHAECLKRLASVHALLARSAPKDATNSAAAGARSGGGAAGARSRRGGGSRRAQGSGGARRQGGTAGRKGGGANGGARAKVHRLPQGHPRGRRQVREESLVAVGA